MKKLLSIVGLFSFVAVATAQPTPSPVHNVQSFLVPGISAVYVTNTFGITNLFTAGAEGTNQVGTAYTNSGTLIVAAAANYQPLLNDVNLWIPRDGRDWASYYTNANGAPLVFDIPMNVSVTYSSGSGANAAVTFVIVPMVDDTHEVTADPWTWSFTAVASQTATTISTNVTLLTHWPGAKKLRLRRITNADTDATSHVIITAVQLNGYK